MRLCGPGRQEVVLPAGTRSYNLKPARSGHWLLPRSKFKEVNATKPTGYPFDKLHPGPEPLDFIASGQSGDPADDVEPKDQEKAKPAATGYGVAPGRAEAGAKCRAKSRAAAISRPAPVLEQDTVQKEVRFEDASSSAAPSGHR